MGAVYARASRVLIWLGQDLKGRASEAFRITSHMYWSNENWDQKETVFLGQIVSKIWLMRVWVVSSTISNQVWDCRLAVSGHVA